MIIDPNNGILTLEDGQQFSPNMYLVSNEQSTRARDGQPTLCGYSSFETHFDQHRVSAQLYAEQSQLKSIVLVIVVKERPPGWPSGTEVFQIENDRKRFHDDLLRLQLGPPHAVKSHALEAVRGFSYLEEGDLQYSFQWGMVTSGFELKTPLSFIEVKYY